MNCSEISALFCSHDKWYIFYSNHKNTAFCEVVKFHKMWAYKCEFTNDSASSQGLEFELQTVLPEMIPHTGDLGH